MANSSTENYIKNPIPSFYLKGENLGFVLILWKVLTQKYKMFIMGNCVTCTTNCNHTIGVTVYTLEMWFFEVHKSKYPA